MKMITDIAARDAIIARITSASERERFVSDWTRAKYLARGEMIVGISGGFGNSAIFSPAGARDSCKADRILFYNANGVLAHEERARVENRALLFGE